MAQNSHWSLLCASPDFALLVGCMAYGYQINRRVVAPVFHFVDPRTLVLSSPTPPPTLSLPPFGYVVSAPFAAFQRPFFLGNFFFPRLALDPAVLIQMEDKSTQSLFQVSRGIFF